MNNRPGHVFVSKEIREKRYQICKDCEHFIKSFKGCSQCGCLVPAKIQFVVNKCPVEKW